MPSSPGGNPSPPEPPAATPHHRGGLLVTALVVAVLALVVSLAGVALSVVALNHSGTVADNRQLPAPLPTADETPQPPQPQPPTPTPTGPATTPGDVDPSAEFVINYQNQRLRVETPSCYPDNRTGIDLDEPRVLGAEGDITYGGCLPGTIETALPSAEVSGQDATPADCLENIRTSPGRSPVAPSNGMTLCFVTSDGEAAAQAITKKLVFVTIDATTQKDDYGVLNITLKAWDVPE